MIIRKFDVIAIGSATIDIFVETGDHLFGNIHSKFPFGSKILANKITFDTGGGGTNVSVALSRLGLKTAYLGKLAEDENEHKILEALRKDKVNTSLIVYGKGKNGISVIIDSTCCDRTILALKGINDKLNFNELNSKKLKTKWFYFCTMLGQSFKTLEKLAEYALNKNISVAFNPSTYLAKKGYSYSRNILRATTVLVLNKEEAGYITNETNLKKIFAKLHSFGPKIVCITQGKKGTHASDNDKIYYLPTSDKKVIEATGAGDSFGAGFVAGIIKGLTIQDSMKLGQANAESVISHFGAKNKLLTYREAQQKIKSVKKVIIK